MRQLQTFHTASVIKDRRHQIGPITSESAYNDDSRMFKKVLRTNDVQKSNRMANSSVTLLTHNVAGARGYSETRFEPLLVLIRTGSNCLISCVESDETNLTGIRVNCLYICKLSRFNFVL